MRAGGARWRLPASEGLVIGDREAPLQRFADMVRRVAIAAKVVVYQYHRLAFGPPWFTRMRDGPETPLGWRPDTSTLPGRASVAFPLFQTRAPPTNTFSMPVARIPGSLNV